MKAVYYVERQMIILNTRKTWPHKEKNLTQDNKYFCCTASFDTVQVSEAELTCTAIEVAAYLQLLLLLNGSSDVNQQSLEIRIIMSKIMSISDTHFAAEVQTPWNTTYCLST